MLQNHFIQATFRLLFLIVLIAGSIYTIFKISSYTYPFIAAFILAYIINPLVNVLEKKFKAPRGFAVFISIVILLASLGALLTFLVFEIIDGTQFLMDVVPKYFQSFVKLGEVFVLKEILPLYENILSRFHELDHGKQTTIISNIEHIGDSITNWGTAFVTNSLLEISSIIRSLPATISALIVSLLATFFISKDWDKLIQLKNEKIPVKITHIWSDIFQQLRSALVGFIKAQLTLITMTTIIVAIGLVTLGVPYAITIALIIGIVDLLPYLGTGIVLIPWVLYSHIAGNTRFAVALLILYILVLIQRQIMEPKIISSQIGIHPLATLAAVFIGYQLFGFLGFILGPIIVIIIETLRKAKVLHHAWKFIHDLK